MPKSDPLLGGWSLESSADLPNTLRLTGRPSESSFPRFDKADASGAGVKPPKVLVLGVLAPLLNIDGAVPPLGAGCPFSLGFFRAPKIGVEGAAELALDVGAGVPKMFLIGSLATSVSVAFWGAPRAPKMFLTGSFAAGSVSAAFCGVPNIGGAVEAGFCVPKMD